MLNARIASLKKLETSENITKELAELDLLCKEIQERSVDHKEMQKGTYKEDNDFVPIFQGAFSLTGSFRFIFMRCSGAEVHEIGTKKAVATA